ncbi:hypothetical protein [Actibacterium sp. 188UL27-1]|uniref:hypothetical protein n=1 Tax=Actibacterium sp. 188UL27-1 TaxID=2786961 RepID=UPI00195CA8E4|nr:hypothetical protein [Actibacterium sp. 188UL27-1]MBM7066344.1 hypothetical protein [Actibacterium sp. 188UL27-1]
MTDNTASSSGGDGRRSVDLVILAAVGAAVIVFLWFMSGSDDRRLQSSAIGFDGLGVWLRTSDVDASTFRGGFGMSADGIGLNIVPLYDLDLNKRRNQPETKRDLLSQQEEFDISREVVATKIRDLPTLIILPKWGTGTRLTGVAHPVLRVTDAKLNTLLSQIAPGLGSVSFSETAFTNYDVNVAGQNLQAELYLAQTIDGPDCTPVIGRRDEMLLARCKIDPTGNDQQSVLILSDPDLLNNHGLRLGDNAHIARALLPDLADGQRVLIDYTNYSWVVDADAPQRADRTWADLLRFFSYPFSLLWIGFGAVAILFVWRSFVRYGAPRRLFDEGPGAAKTVSIGARARLLRLSNHDGALLADYLDARLTDLAHRLLGPAAANSDTARARIDRILQRRNPELAHALAELTARIRGLSIDIPAAEAIAHVDDLETLLEQIAHDT